MRPCPGNCLTPADQKNSYRNSTISTELGLSTRLYSHARGTLDNLNSIELYTRPQSLIENVLACTFGVLCIRKHSIQWHRLCAHIPSIFTFSTAPFSNIFDTATNNAFWHIAKWNFKLICIHLPLLYYYITCAESARVRIITRFISDFNLVTFCSLSPSFSHVFK